MAKKSELDQLRSTIKSLKRQVSKLQKENRTLIRKIEETDRQWSRAVAMTTGIGV